MVSPVLFSSKTSEWSTPQAFFECLNDEFHFTVDVCASADNAKCPVYFDEAKDGLAQPWEGVWWCNPPYGRTIGRWTSKAAISLGSTGVMLLPARTDTKWFHQDVLPHADELRFIEGRLHFGGSDSPAPFPSVLAIFRPRRFFPTLRVAKAIR